ncbi:MAG: hypothetical protein PHQ41_02275, partial [Candidatus Cloacimonetes bacterium]|nr:hypothetical protein [Candidatus Cloacimonadota bacterium]
RPTGDRVDPAVVEGEAIGFMLLNSGVLGRLSGSRESFLRGNKVSRHEPKVSCHETRFHLCLLGFGDFLIRSASFAVSL